VTGLRQFLRLAQNNGAARCKKCRCLLSLRKFGNWRKMNWRKSCCASAPVAPVVIPANWSSALTAAKPAYGIRGGRPLLERLCPQLTTYFQKLPIIETNDLRQKTCYQTPNKTTNLPWMLVPPSDAITFIEPPAYLPDFPCGGQRFESKLV
jgi:hypothetical protein